jgi:hypothetical protein
MLKRRLAVPAALAAAAVAATGVAAATRHAQSTQPAAADLNATSVSRSHTDTCTASDGTYQQTTATYTGTASSSDARLNGTLEIRATSVVNTTTKLGWLEGTLRIRGSNAGATGTVRAAIANGTAVGSVVGEGQRPGAKLVASISAGFGQDAGFSSGKLGSGSASGAGVLFSRGDCRKAKRVHQISVFRLHLTPGQVVPRVTGLRADATGSLTLDVTRDANGAIASGKVVFYANYHFPGSVTVTGLALHQGARGTNGPVVLDSGVGTFTDADGRGNVTKVVDNAPVALLQALLAAPRGYDVDLSTSANTGGALRDQLEGPAHH